MDSENSSDNQSSGRLLQMVAQHDRALRAYARIIVRSLDDVDDVMQEASLIIWEKHGQLRREEEFLPWAKVIVRNVCFRHRRRSIRDRHVFDDALVQRLLDEEDADERQHGDRLAAEYGALVHCLEQLPADRRELVLMPYRGAGAVRKAAEDSARSAASVYKLLQRLRAKLLECVEGKLEAQS